MSEHLRYLCFETLPAIGFSNLVPRGLGLILNLSNDIIDEDSKEYENSLRSIGRMTLTSKGGYSTINTQSSKFKKSGEKANPLEAWRNLNIYTIIPENKIKNTKIGNL